MTSNRPYLLRAVHEWICDNGLTPYVLVDATHPGVVAPPQAVSDGKLVLNLAPRAVARLEIGNDAITCMARFSGVSQSVQLPIAAVQAIYARENGQGMLMAEDPPGTATAPSGVADAKPASPTLQAVPSAAQQDVDVEAAVDGDGANSAGDDPDRPRPKGKPNLRVIK
ncbi:MAG TPA: ClpXP protease specificity-enhancing factor [Rhodanobacteraceae bacterium]|jgi:stringent starvation protein B|nr:ClpXP protease specificity-enhancing factor [Rhodanobacteraceae bacterium]